MIRRPPRSTLSSSSAASDVYKRQVLCSATLPRALLDFARGGGDAGMAALKEPVEYIRLDAETKISENLKIAFMQLRPEEKIGGLLFLLRMLVKKDEQTIIFVATRHHVELLAELLPKCGFPVSPVFGQMDQAARVIHLAKFQKKQSMILLVTDVAARGIDIPLLANVINFDFPAKPKLFVHRVGRTARQGQTGTAYSLVANDELPYMLDLMLFLGVKPRSTPKDPSETTSGTFYGNLPRHLLDEESDSCRNLIETDGALAAQYRVATNAYKLYNKTRESASKSSAVRTRELPPCGIHPWVQHLVSHTEEQKVDMMAAVKGYRTKSTILELKTDSAAFHTMKRKRVTDGYLISQKAEQQKRKKEKEEQDQDAPQEMEEEEVGTNNHKWKDSEFFIDYEAPDRDRAADFGFEIGGSHMQMEGDALDLGGDTESGMQKAKQVRKWDAKKKRYVMMELDGEGRAKRQKVNEAGGVVDSKALKHKGRSYKDWQKKMRTSIPKVGDEESAHVARAAAEHAKEEYKWVNGRRIKIGAKEPLLTGPDKELRSKDQIAKLRKEEEKKKNRNSKGHSGGKSAEFGKGGKGKKGGGKGKKGGGKGSKGGGKGGKGGGTKQGTSTHGGDAHARMPGPGARNKAPTKKAPLPSTKFTKGKAKKK
eukprot:TRINITY_DN9877_c0_g1_i3.p1 TRINITY_DN9877_c0_g1~~TRINITY_DN9877_c0_g1_i3.p1  ORF type:complete len:652 (-),score=223.55 TRINITY_DN9877_c0_g1_i3:53-2008(-)